MDEINEKTTGVIQLDFVDNLGVAVIPTTMSYGILDTATKTVIRVFAVANPAVIASTYNLIISDTENRLLNQDNPKEERLVFVSFEYGQSKKATGQYSYWVVNVSGIT